MIHKIKWTLTLFLIAICFSVFAQITSRYQVAIEKWHEAREAELKTQYGWLSLVGLYWLKEGINHFGAASNNDIVFPKDFPLANAGSFILDKGKVILHTNALSGIKITNLNNTDSVIYSNEDSKKSLESSIQGFKWIIIKRQDKFGIRLWNANSIALKQFNGIPRFPVDTNWRIRAELIPATLSDGLISFKNKIGQDFENKPVGKLRFEYQEKLYTLDIMSESPNGYFIVFGDKTSGKQTYASGRFLTIEKADTQGYTYIDFNKAINPPCAFSDYATCPLPPKSNILLIEISAGEKDYHHH